MKLPYFDCHCDTILAIREGDSLRSGAQHVTLDKAMAVYPKFVQFYAIFTNMGAEARKECKTEAEFPKMVREGTVAPTPSFIARHDAAVAKFLHEMDKNADLVVQCRTTDDIDRALAAGKSAAILTLEGAEELAGTSLREAYDLGVRACTLTWNYKNRVGGSNVTGGGITAYGKAFLRECEGLGVLVDVSHASEALFYDVARRATRPFIATHSNARALGPHRRNLTDEQFLAICRAGGVAGFNLYGAFITSDGVCTLDDCADHIQHFLSLGGARHIAIGGDLDGCDVLPEGIRDVGDVHTLADALARRGVAVSVIEDIYFNNIYRVCKEVFVS